MTCCVEIARGRGDHSVDDKIKIFHGIDFLLLSLVDKFQKLFGCILFLRALSSEFDSRLISYDRDTLFNEA